jgi:hypothetical protein
MGLLGWWVVRVADEATSVAQSRLRGNTCQPLPEAVVTSVVVDSGGMIDEAPPAPGPGSDAGPGSGSATDPGSGSGSGSATDPGTGSDAGSATDPGSGPRIVIDEPTMTLKPTTVKLVFPDTFVPEYQEHVRCELDRAGRIADLAHGQRRIQIVLIVSGVIVVVGLVLFGIKMTHRVAGPLYKVTLYLAKLRDGRYDKVYDLRKGDQLVEFYQHFKEAHAGVVALEQGDRDRIAAALDAAAADGLFDRSPEAKAAADELRAILDRKEKALGQK